MLRNRYEKGCRIICTENTPALCRQTVRGGRVTTSDITIEELQKRCAPGYPKGPIVVSGAQHFADTTWSDFAFRAARQEGLRITVRTGIEAIQGGVFFGKRLRALELNLLRPEGPARIYVTVEACSNDAKLMAWRCDLSGNNAATNRQVDGLMKAIGAIATENTTKGATALL